VIGNSAVEYKSIARYIHQSPYKMRKSLNIVRGMKVDEALSHLHFSKDKASKIIEKTLRSAVSNFVNQNQDNEIDQNILRVKEAFVDGGPVMKRFRAASMGRASRLRRPTSHLTVIISEKDKGI